MINGEGKWGNTSTITSPTHSDYSSCGESDFERYCSANSVMGTPSFCSSVGTFNDFLDLDFGSVKNSGVSDDRALAKNLLKNLGDKSDRSVSSSGEYHFNEDTNSLDSPKMSNMKNSANTSAIRDNDSGFSRTRFLRVQREECSGKFEDLSRSSDSQIGRNVYDEEFRENVDNSIHHFDCKENGSVDEDESSSRYGLSDEDGSMFNDGSDDEHRMDSYMRNLHYRQDSRINNENPLLIGSSVAFGSEDWDDFMHETENGLVGLSLNKSEDKPQENLETERELVNKVRKPPFSAVHIGKEQEEIVRNVPVVTCVDNVKERSESLSTRDSMAQEKGVFARKALLNTGTDIKDSAAERELPYINNKELFLFDEGDASENGILGKSKPSERLLDITGVQLSSTANIDSSSKEAVHDEYHKVAVRSEYDKVHEAQLAIEDDLNACVKAKEKSPPTSVKLSQEHLAPIKVGNFEAKESYDEVVLEMEEILLDSMETPGARFPHSKRSPQPFRDGSSTASTSGTYDAYSPLQEPLKIDRVEVVGAKQKKGDVSLGERLVGVKEYTVYLLRVESGKDQWEVERRYRDFFTLYRQLKTLYASHGWSLPSPWSRVEQESRKIFGNASPKIVGERSTLIQECLRSILHSSTPNSVPSTLNWFLSPQKAISSSPTLNTFTPHSTSAFTGGSLIEEVSTFGKTISLLVEIQPRKSVRQLIEAQHYICAGCHTRLDAEKSLLRELAHTLGWGKPRLCEYTGQLFCASCHTNETAVLPARVLHFWDFTEYPVSQMAKSYLDSIYDQPMLCVSAVNPFLFSKVPALFHVMSIRKKIGAMMPYVRCPFRGSIQRGVGSRRYLLENNEFFALRDLVDLSKGAFSALPVMVGNVSKKILDHIMQQCLICYDVGIPCGARQACEDPSSLIFPFQEDEVKRCRNCDLVFHKPCFRSLSNCPCRVSSVVGESAGPSANLRNDSISSEGSDTLGRKSDSGSPVKFLSYMFSKRKQKVLARENSNPVIHMDSLPSTFSDPL